MATSAAGGGPGPGPGGSFMSAQAPVKRPQVALVVVGAAALVYGFCELRLRASRKLGLIPKSVERDWQDAEVGRLRHMPFESHPGKFCFMNPHRHNIPASRAVFVEE